MHTAIMLYVPVKPDKDNDMKNQITEYSATEASLAKLRKDLSGVLFDCGTAAGMKEAKSSRMMLVKTRTGLEKIRKEIKAPALEHCKDIDTEAHRITDEILALEEPIQAQIKKEENRVAEQEFAKRKAAEEEKQQWITRIEAIRRRPLDFIGKDPDTILEAIVKARKIVVADKFPQEFWGSAEEAFLSAIGQMEAMHIQALDAAADKKRLSELPVESETVNDDPHPPSDRAQVQSAPIVIESHTKLPRWSKPTGTDEIINPETVGVPPPDITGVFHEIIEESVQIDNLIIAAKAVCDHFGKFSKVHPTIEKLISAISDAESV